MKKNILAVISLLIISSSINLAYSQTNRAELADAIKLYKQGNYSQCHTQLEDFIKKDPSRDLSGKDLGFYLTYQPSATKMKGYTS